MLELCIGITKNSLTKLKVSNVNCFKQKTLAIGLLLALPFATSSQAAPNGTTAPNQGSRNQTLYTLAELKKPDYSAKTNEALEHGFGLYNGKTGLFDRCKIIISLEKAHRLGQRYLGYPNGILDMMYEGNWSAIAALEGEPLALIRSAKAFDKSVMGTMNLAFIEREGNAVASPSYKFAVSKAYQKYRLALSTAEKFEIKGYMIDLPNLKKRLEFYKTRAQKWDKKLSDKPIMFRQIFCQPRVGK